MRGGTDGGLGKKPSDIFTLPLSKDRHREQHQIGERAFEQKYRGYFSIGLKATALKYARWSPSYFKDEEFREGVNTALKKA